MLRNLLILLIFPLFLTYCSSEKKEAEFIRIEDQKFIKDGKPYFFTGVNMWYAAYLGSTAEGQKRLMKELDTLKALGVDNIRILAGSEKTSFIMALPVTFQTAPGVYNDSLLKGLDFTLNEMAKREMYAVLYFTNYWQWSGGMSQYVAWANNETPVDPDSTKDWRAFMTYSARFYSDEKAVKMYYNYIEFLINRVNTYNGTAYKNDPAIMAWELANEPRPGVDGEPGEANAENFIKWVHNTCKFIHTLDSNHLVTAGSEGTVGTVNNRDIFVKAYSSPYVDYLNVHVWAKNWGWFNAKDVNGTIESSISKAQDYINNHIALARELKKPITMEEFGLDRDSSICVPNSSVSARDKYFKAIFSLINDSIKNGAPIPGSNIWAWGGYGLPAPVREVCGNSGSYLGDPLCEPQGLNSVYVSDTSTLKLIARTIEQLP